MSDRSSAIAFAATVLAATYLLSKPARDKLSSIQGQAGLDDANNTDKITAQDLECLAQCHEFRLSIDPPLQSNFRVVCLMVLQETDGSASKPKVSTIWGTNDEPSPWMGGALCAERSAFLQLRVQERDLSIKSPSTKSTRKVQSLYIVSDAEIPITPGVLCREYMMGSHYVDPDRTRFIMQSSVANDAPVLTSLTRLYPYPCIYKRKTSKQACTLGSQLASTIDWTGLDSAVLTAAGLKVEDLQNLVKAAHAASAWDEPDSLHPVRYGAAALVRRVDSASANTPSLHIVSTCQCKAVEYGGTLDAVGQLASLLRQESQVSVNNGAEINAESAEQSDAISGESDKADNKKNVVAIAMVDQFGIPHAPFAPGRSFLAEHGYTGTVCLVSSLSADNRVLLSAVLASDLVPNNFIF
jgi:cytidine deaminase